MPWRGQQRKKEGKEGHFENLDLAAEGIHMWRTLIHQNQSRTQFNVTEAKEGARKARAGKQGIQPGAGAGAGALPLLTSARDVPPHQIVVPCPASPVPSPVHLHYRRFPNPPLLPEHHHYLYLFHAPDDDHDDNVDTDDRNRTRRSPPTSRATTAPASARPLHLSLLHRTPSSAARCTTPDCTGRLFHFCTCEPLSRPVSLRLPDHSLPLCFASLARCPACFLLLLRRRSARAFSPSIPLSCTRTIVGYTLDGNIIFPIITSLEKKDDGTAPCCGCCAAVPSSLLCAVPSIFPHLFFPLHYQSFSSSFSDPDAPAPPFRRRHHNSPPLFLTSALVLAASG
ncbi:hypothetical protein CKAH01_10345 [Colletotrichum kahawae]|uniref:Uncharacterized protein n=1 Tax=Colletotrichum kahawae TaxID=34407 RepID=A0AAE0CX93_COLKA|nr:hypothetical protein CKAH01_10345 [Colletotrichum kahawae]